MKSKLLDIVITHWTEPWEVGASAFRMLSLQRRVDWGCVHVTVIHDGSDAFPDKYFRDFPFVVDQVCLKHGGISRARNYAIKNSKSEWIKFCDFDDMFAGAYSLSCILNTIYAADNYDMLWFPMIVDVYAGGLDIKEGSPVFLHDKVFRTSFLHENNILFNEDLFYSEDFAFLSDLKFVLDPVRIGKIECNFPIYIFIQRTNSVSNRRRNWLKNRIGHFRSLSYVESMTRKYGEEYDANTMVARIMVESMCAMKTASHDIDMSDYERMVRDYFSCHELDFYAVKNDDLATVVGYANEQNGSDITVDELMRWIGGINGY